MSSENLSPKQEAFLAEARRYLTARATEDLKAPVDRRPPPGYSPGPRPRMSSIKERSEAPVDMSPDGITDNSFPHLMEAHRDLVRLGLRGLWEIETKVHELQRGDFTGQQIVERALPAAERALRQLDNAVVKLTEIAAHYDEEVAKATRPPMNPQEAAELRSFAREQKNALTFITTHILRGDQRLSAAVLSGAPYLSGLSDEQVQTVQTAAAERFAGPQHRARQDALKGVARLQSVRESFETGLVPRLQRWKAESDKSAELDKAFA